MYVTADAPPAPHADPCKTRRSLVTAAGRSFSLELRHETHVPEGTVEAERPAGTRVLLAVGLAARLRIDVTRRRVGDRVRVGVEDVAPARRQRQPLERLVADLEVGRLLGGEQLPRVVVLVAPRAVI